MSIFLQLEGKAETIPADPFITALINFWGALQDIDSSMSNRIRGSVRWEITTLTKSSPANIGIAGRSRIKGMDNTVAVETAFVSGVSELATAAEPPRFYTFSALSHVRKIAAQTRRLQTISVSTDHQRAEFSPNVLTNIDYLISGGSRSLGSVTGSLDALTVHSGHEFRIWDEERRRPIPCRFGKGKLSLVVGYIKRRVTVFGDISRNARGEPVMVYVEDIIPADEGDKSAPSIHEMSGAIPGITEGLNLAEFMERLRDG